MLRRYSRFFASLHLVRDMCATLLAFVIAHHLRFSSWLVGEPVKVPLWDASWLMAGLLVLTWPVAAWMLGLYRSRRFSRSATSLLASLQVTLLSLLLAVFIAYWLGEQRYSRGVLLTWIVVHTSCLACLQWLTQDLLKSLRARGFNLRHGLIVGSGPGARLLAQRLLQRSETGLRLLGYVSCQPMEQVQSQWRDDLPLLGTLDGLSSLLQSQPVDQVLLALEVEELHHLPALMEMLSHVTADVRLVPHIAPYVTLYGGVEDFSGLPMLRLQATPMVGWKRVQKRLFDMVVASCLLVWISPVLLLLAALVRCSGRGPIFYGQERVGLDGQTFLMWKFRTMTGDAERAGAQMAQPGDPRCTPLGRLLRRFSLDELPQLWNVVRGEMSLVGPRPERPVYIEQFRQHIPRYVLRHKIKAGMTGWAQINGLRGNTSIPQRIAMDLYYIEHWSFFFDLHILLRTCLGGFLSPHAY